MSSTSDSDHESTGDSLLPPALLSLAPAWALDGFYALVGLVVDHLAIDERSASILVTISLGVVVSTLLAWLIVAVWFGMSECQRARQRKLAPRFRKAAKSPLPEVSVEPLSLDEAEAIEEARRNLFARSDSVPLPNPLPEGTVVGLYAGQPAQFTDTIQSSFIKHRITECPVRENGLVLDERATASHVCEERGVMQYHIGHYAKVVADLPECTKTLQPPNFGENMSVDGTLTELTLCVGDEVAVGDPTQDGCILQVTQPREPCIKNNIFHEDTRVRDYIADHALSGIFYRVLRPGVIRQGDPVRLVRRVQTKWTAARIMHSLSQYTTTPLESPAELEQVLQLPELAPQHFKKFAKLRLKRIREEEKRQKAEKLAAEQADARRDSVFQPTAVPVPAPTPRRRRAALASG